MELMDQIVLRAKTDEWYQQCLARLNAAEPAFLAIREALTEAQQEQLDAYISACEELEHSKIYLAWQIRRNM